MASRSDTTLPIPRRVRRSLGTATLGKAGEKENATLDLGTSSLAANRKKSRSKSIGPGGLDALKSASGNRRVSLAAPSRPPPRSILKPSPLPEIFVPKKLRDADPAGLSEPWKPNSRTSNSTSPKRATTGKAFDNVSSGSKIAVRSEEEQQATAREREERERRDARRKSLANRRVSFAAEATLHTFHDIEYMQDSTTSTDSTRRRSLMSARSKESSDNNELSTPQKQHIDEESELTRDQRELHKKSRRRSSGVSQASVSENETMMSMYSSDSEPADAVEEIIAEEDSNSSNDSDGDDGTMVTVEDNISMEMSMDVTSAIGGIISKQPVHTPALSPAPPPPVEDQADESMEFTAAVGSIRQTASVDHHSDDDDNEEMSMEFMTVVGGVLATKNPPPADNADRENPNSEPEGATMAMDMTVGVGQILSGGKVTNQEDEGTMDMDMDMTGGMEMTTALGGIMKAPTAETRAISKRIMETEVDEPDSPIKAVLAVANYPQPKITSPMEGTHLYSLVSHSQPKTRTPTKHQSTTTPSRPRLPAKTAAPFSAKSPVLQVARSPTRSPVRAAAKLSAKSPVVSVVRSPTRSPAAHTPTAQQPCSSHGNNTTATTKKSKSPLKSTGKSSVKPSIFQQDPMTGNSTPSIVLTPQKRAFSGVGVDRPGLGSPKVTEILNRRCSLGEATPDFVSGQQPISRVVQFQEPREAGEDDDDREWHSEAMEDGLESYGIDPDTVDDKETTLNLRDMIDSMSPKKNILRGRKSLHVGSAKGVLGKRPAELDEEDEEQDGVKRLKGHQSSPVKNVKLQQPPSKEETTGQVSRHMRHIMDAGAAATPAAAVTSPAEHGIAISTPKRQGRSGNINSDGFTISATPDGANLVEECIQEVVTDDRIHLQDFLNMISVRFMELNTTKRRHTIAPANLNNSSVTGDVDDMSLERCVVTGACTVPMLELYQHSCRELKKYISEGRRMVREIESETFEVNPPLFREYVSATPEIKALMDNQFKNVKAHARLLSKAMWYEWRMKLQDGLKEGLTKIAEGMRKDEEILQQQEQILEINLPRLTKEADALRSEQENLESCARELAACDRAELEAARSQLVALDDDLQEKNQSITQLQNELEEMESVMQVHGELKSAYLNEINEAEKVREECRGWTTGEVSLLKARVGKIEQRHGWAISGICGTVMSMTYRREIELTFDHAAFRHGQKNALIDLCYVADNRETSSHHCCTVEKEFFLQCIRDHARRLPQSRTKISDLLHMVRAGWDRASDVSTSLGRVSLTYPTKTAKSSDSSIVVSVSMLLVPLETKIEIVIRLWATENICVEPTARVVYGEHFNATKIREFLSSKLGKVDGDGDGVGNWSNVLVELQGKLIARGTK